MNFPRSELKRYRNRDDEPVAALVTMEGGYQLPIYEAQVAEANRIIGAYVEAIVAKAKINDEIAEHSRLIGANVPEIF